LALKRFLTASLATAPTQAAVETRTARIARSRRPTGSETSIDPRRVRACSGPIFGVLPSTTEYRSALTVAAGLMTQAWRLTRQLKKRHSAARWSF
jgi:hypothetical protein